MSATVTPIAAAAPVTPQAERAAWAACTALLKMLDTADRLRRETPGTPMHAALTSELGIATSRAMRRCDDFVGVA